MSPASLDLRTLATVVCDLCSVAVGRAPGLQINRAGISLAGASLMIAFGTLEPRGSLQSRRSRRHLRAVQLLLGHTKIESTVRCLGIEVDDALAIAEQVDV
jgi:hypothetical protein